MSTVANTFNNSFPPDCQRASVPIQLQILCSLLIDGCDPPLKGFSQLSKTIAQLVTCIDSERWQVTHHQSPLPRCVDMLRREKHLYQFMLVWNCIHFFTQKLLFSVSFLLGCPFCWCLSICNNISLNMLKKYDLEGVFVASHLTGETITIIAKDNIDLYAISSKAKNIFMEFVWQPCTFHWRKIRVWNKM